MSCVSRKCLKLPRRSTPRNEFKTAKGFTISSSTEHFSIVLFTLPWALKRLIRQTPRATPEGPGKYLSNSSCLPRRIILPVLSSTSMLVDDILTQYSLSLRLTGSYRLTILYWPYPSSDNFVMRGQLMWCQMFPCLSFCIPYRCSTLLTVSTSPN